MTPHRYSCFRGSAWAGCLLLASLACGGRGGGATSDSPFSATVTVSPSYVCLAPGDRQTFTAQATGVSNPTFSWSVLGGSANGTIGQGGAYLAPATTGVFAVRAALATDSSIHGEATVDVSTAPQTGACNSADLGDGASLHGYLPFPSDNPWNQDISGLSVAANSTSIISFIGAGTGLKGDFGSGTWNGEPIGIPYTVVAGSQATVPIHFFPSGYGDESDPGAMPIPPLAPVEGGPDSTGDRHVLVLDRDNCLLYELGYGFPQTGGSWGANVAVVWDLHSNALRPWSWTSADAAGLPIFPGLARYDEVASGAIHHALRFTVPTSRKAYVAPASHQASGNTSTSSPPMGLRVRLKASVNLSGYGSNVQVILRALKQYGMILADNGSAWYISGAPDVRWDNDELRQLGNIKGSDLEVVDTGTVYTSDPTGSAPTIPLLIASPDSISAGEASALTWSTTNATRFFVTPGPGLVRGSGISVWPASTTTYILTAQGPYGDATRTVTVTVH